jgi:cytochrome c-type biogenesis protein CcsB
MKNDRDVVHGRQPGAGPTAIACSLGRHLRPATTRSGVQALACSSRDCMGLAMHSLCSRLTMVTLFLLLCGNISFAVNIDQAKPGALPSGHPAVAPSSAAPTGDVTPEQIAAQDRTKFAADIKLDDLRLLEVLHRDQVKILDSWARQSLSTMMHHQSYEGHDALYTALDMAFRPEAWQDKNIIFVQAIPIRQRLSVLADGPTEEFKQAERQRILQTGMVSPAFMEQREVGDLLERTAAADVRLADSIRKVMDALEVFRTLRGSLFMAPPASGTNETWMHPYQLQGNVPMLAQAATQRGDTLPAVPGYAPTEAISMVKGFGELEFGWRSNDAAEANDGIRVLVDNAPAINPTVYHDPFKRKVELWYNRLFNGTLLAGSLYFIAVTLFLIGAVGVTTASRKWAMGFFTLALLVHIAAMAIRWWLAGRIPIQNQFESVLGSAMLGCILGWVLEVRKRNNLFGLALSFVGWLAMTACFAVPYIWGKEIGESIGKVAGVLSDYWLYIHVNVVICSYALISASFALGGLYLLVKLWHWISPLEQPASALTAAQAVGVSRGGTATMEAGGGSDTTQIARERARFLEQLDGANVVVLQMAFWALGTGIVCGAIWADHSWGRPWGWDPKETFALVTWIVYLIIVHVRFVTPRNKAMWTSALSVIGFGVMLFNWIGVNFFLAGLHSYA